MLAVDVGVGHQHDLVVPQLVDVELVLDAGAEGGDERLDLVVLQHLVDARLLDVDDLAADGQDRLGARIAALTGRAAGRVALDDEDLAVLRLAARAVDELARHAGAAEQALAVAGEVARLAGGDARRGRIDGLAGDLLALRRVLLEPLAELVVDDLLHEGLHLGVAELGLGLALELRLGHLHADDGGEALADVVAAEVRVLLLEDVPLAGELVHQRGERRAEALLVRAALGGVDRVGERVDRLGVGVVPLHRDLGAHPLVVGLALDVDDGRVRDALAGVDVLDEVGDAALVVVAHAADLLDLVGVGIGVLVELGDDGGRARR